ncbi:kinase-like domain-containing protein [Rhizoctonia solani]|nr:kinase-like domain-containing protein [Rhizoctonia solani]
MEVAVKILRIAVSPNSHEERKLKSAAHELYIWTKCKHQNILELIGMATFHGSLAMVSPWVGNSNLSWFLSQNPQVDRYKICSQVAEGVAHMHSVRIVHGDIKCGNILVSHDHVPKLMDFGSSTLKREYTMKFKVSSGQPAFSLRWAAPELLPEEDEAEAEPTFGSDIYALGMTFLEIMSGKVPYSDLLREASVVRRIIQHSLPKRPEDCMVMGDARADELWDLMINTWAKESENRPEADTVTNRECNPVSILSAIHLIQFLLLDPCTHHSQSSSHPSTR